MVNVSSDQKKSLGDAVDFASQRHASQKWKDTESPFLFHPLAVASLVLRHGGNTAQATAAVLHDTIGDAEVTHALVKERFGAEVADLVFAFADPELPADKASDWVECKKAYLQKARGQSEAALLVIACEELQDLGELLSDLKYRGASVWKRYPVHAMQVFWYYRELLVIFNSRLREDAQRALLGEFAAKLATLQQSVAGF